MSSDHPTKDQVIAAFLERYWKDRDEGQGHGFRHYAAMFPGHAEAVATEFLAIEGGNVSSNGRLEAPTADPIQPQKIDREIGRG